MTPGLLLDQLVAGLVSGMILFIIALGLSFTFGVLRVVNFAHGALYMVGAYVTWSSIARFGIPFWAATLLSVTCLGALGALIEMVLLRRIYRAELMMQLLLTFGLVYILTDAAKFIWGLEYHSVAVPALLTGTVSPGGRGMTRLLHFYHLHGIGRRPGTLACAPQNAVRTLREGSHGKQRNHLNPWHQCAFHLHPGFCLRGGFSRAGRSPGRAHHRFSPGIELIIVECFIVVVIGGLGSITGTLVASLIIGVVTALGISTIPQQALVIPYALMALILLVRPWGLFGRPE